jgi:HSP20 family protein
MSRERKVLVNFERMWREMDEMLGDPFGNQRTHVVRQQAGFRPRVDVYYEGGEGEEPRAVVEVELAGVDIDTVSLEVAGRELVISGERPLRETGGRLYQQVEIEAGPFRRVVELGTDVVADRARAGYDDGVLRVELPLAGLVTRRVPFDPKERP